ncbi:hypothetical protein Amsp01_089280 [Amycolatopsis sp. NBRC 101858]|nr:hypothetical protein Amsp01_089280 [Amycolatopsis sp. NBRC 101858]
MLNLCESGNWIGPGLSGPFPAAQRDVGRVLNGRSRPPGHGGRYRAQQPARLTPDHP